MPTPLPPLWSLGFQQSRYTYFPRTQVEEIAKLKLVDLNTESLASAVKSVAGTARSMGITVEK